MKLYSLSGCPFCLKVERKLEALDLSYERQEVPRASGQRDEVRAVSDQTNVPVLVDPSNDITGMAESDDIVAYLERTYN